MPRERPTLDYDAGGAPRWNAGLLGSALGEPFTGCAAALSFLGWLIIYVSARPFGDPTLMWILGHFAVLIGTALGVISAVLQLLMLSFSSRYRSRRATLLLFVCSGMIALVNVVLARTWRFS